MIVAHFRQGVQKPYFQGKGVRRQIDHGTNATEAHNNRSLRRQGATKTKPKKKTNLQSNLSFAKPTSNFFFIATTMSQTNDNFCSEGMRTKNEIPMENWSANFSHVLRTKQREDLDDHREMWLIYLGLQLFHQIFLKKDTERPKQSDQNID